MKYGNKYPREKKSYEEHYSNEYFDDWVENSFRSAKVILGILYKEYQARSVADFGCGRGVWLTTCEMLGSEVLHGYDGPWVDKKRLYSKNIDFFPVNFEERVKSGRRYDLAISVEVAEHVSEANSDNFVDMMVESSDVIVFGAATKGQGGENHVNEKWQSYWIEKFRTRGFVCFDIFRAAVWHNNDVDWWYKQNTFLFVKEKVLREKFDANRLKSLESVVYDIVHPDSFEYRLNLFNVVKESGCAQLSTKIDALVVEMETMKASKFWKLRSIYMRAKSIFRF